MISPTTLIFGVTLGFFAGSWTMAQVWDVSHLRSTLYECQKELPRSQKCELIAVVKEGK